MKKNIKFGRLIFAFVLTAIYAGCAMATYMSMVTPDAQYRTAILTVITTVLWTIISVQIYTAIENE